MDRHSFGQLNSHVADMTALYVLNNKPPVLFYLLKTFCNRKPIPDFQATEVTKELASKLGTTAKIQNRVRTEKNLISKFGNQFGM